ncbi:unnamed protein product [Closterium sp. Yama58-4]|nr:unnamed protein product [Closterium sp. Yama58-4]
MTYLRPPSPRFFRSHSANRSAGDNGDVSVSSSFHREYRVSGRTRLSFPAPEVANSDRISAAAAPAPAGQIPPPPDATSLSSPAFVVWGANTGVGKTLVSAGLAVALLARAARGRGAEGGGGGKGDAADGGRGVQGENEGNGGGFHLEYVKPLQTGYPEAFHLFPPLSAPSRPCFPPSAPFRARPLRLPCILVGDGRLGGISVTVAAVDSLAGRGYDVAAVVVCGDEEGRLDNADYLKSYLRPRGIPVISLPALPSPPPTSDPSSPSSPSLTSSPSSSPTTSFQTSSYSTLNPNLIDWLGRAGGSFQELVLVLERFHWERLRALERAAERAHEILWWPFTQHGMVGVKDVTVIDSRAGENFSVFRSNQTEALRGSAGESEARVEPRREVREEVRLEEWFDGCASWWTQGLGPVVQAELSREIGVAMARYGHVMFPENTHPLALEAAELLLKGVGRGWASRVFFSDNGSTAIEVALKMAFRSFCSQNGVAPDGLPDLKVIALTGSYHGDTLAAMHAQSPSPCTSFQQQPWYGGKGVFLDPPTVEYSQGQWLVVLPSALSSSSSTHNLFFQTRSAVFHKERDSTPLAPIYHDYIQQQLQPFLLPSDSSSGGPSGGFSGAMAAALIIEPVLHGAGGMVMIDPLFQRTLVSFCRARAIPVIFDEVFADSWRLGTQSAAELLGCSPDIACYAKLLTGGMIPLAVTLASSSVFDAFYGSSKLHALLHGHSYTAHPAGCAAACVSLKALSDPARNPNLLPNGSQLKELWDPSLVEQVSCHPSIQRVLAIGTVFVAELKTDGAGYGSSAAKDLLSRLRQHGIYARPLGNVVYFMCGPFTPPSTCTRLLRILLALLD